MPRIRIPPGLYSIYSAYVVDVRPQYNDTRIFYIHRRGRKFESFPDFIHSGENQGAVLFYGGNQYSNTYNDCYDNACTISVG